MSLRIDLMGSIMLLLASKNPKVSKTVVAFVSVFMVHNLSFS